MYSRCTRSLTTGQADSVHRTRTHHMFWLTPIAHGEHIQRRLEQEGDPVPSTYYAPASRALRQDSPESQTKASHRSRSSSSAKMDIRACATPMRFVILSSEDSSCLRGIITCPSRLFSLTSGRPVCQHSSTRSTVSGYTPCPDLC